MKIEEIKAQAIKYFGNELTADIWMKKYALRNDGELIETDPYQTIMRLYNEIIRIENKYNDRLIQPGKLLKMMTNMDFILGGSNIFGIGNPYVLTSLGNCFVVGNSVDSYGGICKTDEEQLQLMKRRGGVGHDLSHIRPKGIKVNNAAGTSTGIVPFMERYSNSTREVSQEGRRGALMLTCDIEHPDILDFITAKDDTTKITGANISVKISDTFMYALNHLDHIYRIKMIWDKIIHQAWKTAEPGVIFIDKIIRESPADCYTDKGFGTISTNPCGELPLCPYDSCRLLAINLFNIVDDPFTEDAQINWTKLRDIAYYSQVVMDNIIDLEEEKIRAILAKLHASDEPLQIRHTEIDLWNKILIKLSDGRRTGIGIMGLADMFAALSLEYGSPRAISLAEQVQSEIAVYCYSASIVLATTRGAFPIFDKEKEKNNPFINRILDEIWITQNEFSDISDVSALYHRHGRRNIACLTIAPTGTISQLAGVSSGIEPVYNIYYQRKMKVSDPNEATSTDATGDMWKSYLVIHPKFKYWFYEAYVDQWLDKTLEEYSTEELDKLIKRSPYANSSAYQIDPVQKIKMQGRMQKWIDHSISVTHNLPKDTTIEYVDQLYRLAYQEGCKGMTIYRDGSREGVLTINSDKKDDFTYHDAPKRPKDLPAELFHITVKGEKYVIVVGFMDDKPYEIFARRDDNTYTETKGIIRKIRKRRFDYITAHNGIPNLQDEENPFYKIVTIYTSALLRHGTKPEFIIHMIDKFDLDITSMVSAVQRILKKYIANDTETHENCPECGEKLSYEGGCNVCKSCGYSKCS